MPRVETTRHLHRFFPQLDAASLRVDGTTVAEVLASLEAIAPGITFYVCDERGRLRRHVNIFVGEHLVSDRQKLSDPVASDTRVLIMQALSGG